MDNRELITRIVNLNSIVAREEKLPRKLSYALTKNIMELQELYRPYDKEREDILEKYARKGENGEILYLDEAGVQSPDIPEDSYQAYEKELEELLSVQVEFTPQKVTLEDLPETIDAMTLYKIAFMVED